MNKPTTRPLISFSILQLEEAFETAASIRDANKIRAIAKDQMPERSKSQEAAAQGLRRSVEANGQKSSDESWKGIVEFQLRE